MPTLNLGFTLDITEPNEKLLCEVLKCQPAGLEAELARFGPAAVSEYIDMFTGAGTISTAADVRERRLVALMITRFKGASPSADQVARLFNMTPSAARALLRSVAGKHRLKIADELEKAIKALK